MRMRGNGSGCVTSYMTAKNKKRWRVHVYFQLSSYHYPVEIQSNTYYDRQLNNRLHKYVYKRKYKDQVGYRLRQAYESEFKEVLGNVLSDSKEIR